MTAYWRDNDEKTTKGRWEHLPAAVQSLGRSARRRYSKRRYVYGKSKADVRAKLRKALADKEAGIALAESLTVGAFMDRWLETVKDTVRPSPFKPYEAITRLHIKPT